MAVIDLEALRMPKWGKIVAWLKQTGSAVHPGEAIVEVETEKIVNVVESRSAATLLGQTAALNEICPVGGLLGVLGPAETPAEVVDAFVEAFQVRFQQEQQAVVQATPIEPSEVFLGPHALRYLSLGRGELPVLLIHGIGSDLNSWLFNQSALAESHRVIAVDLLGHGGSSKTLAAGTIEELTQPVADLLQVLHLDRIHLVGHSLGGSVAAQLALQLPERVATLSLISSVGPGTRVSDTFLTAFLGAIKRRDLQASMSQLVADPGLITRDLVENILRVKRLEGVQECWEKITRKALLEPAEEAPVSVLSQLDVPVAVIFGAQDRIAAVPRAEEMPPGVTLHLLEGSGHIPHMESSSTVNALLVRFISTHNA